MEVILKEDIINLGYKDDIVTVKNGYGRNFLIPQGKAIVATESAKKMLAEDLKQRAHKIAAMKDAAQERAKALDGVKLVISVKTGAQGAIYGSVNNIQIAEELEKKGIEIDRKIIVVKGVKALGSYTASVRFHKEVNVDLPFDVVSENEPVVEAKEEVKEEATQEEA